LLEQLQIEKPEKLNHIPQLANVLLITNLSLIGLFKHLYFFIFTRLVLTPET